MPLLVLLLAVELVSKYNVLGSGQLRKRSLTASILPPIIPRPALQYGAPPPGAYPPPPQAYPPPAGWQGKQ